MTGERWTPSQDELRAAFAAQLGPRHSQIDPQVPENRAVLLGTMLEGLAGAALEGAEAVGIDLMMQVHVFVVRDPDNPNGPPIMAMIGAPDVDEAVESVMEELLEMHRAKRAGKGGM